MADDKSSNPMPMQGEGDYISARKFNTEEPAFAKSGKVGPAAKDAADALDGAEAAELEAARLMSAKGESVTNKP